MKLTLLVNYDLASNLALHFLLPELCEHSVTIFYTDKPNQSRDTPAGLKQLSEFEQQLLQDSGLNLFANAQLNIEKCNQINSGEDFALYQKSAPDLVISIRHMSILKPATIAVAKQGVINLHSGLLPEYRGVMATFWALRNKEPAIGTSLHFIEDSKIDTGKIIDQSTTVTRFDQSYLWNVLNIYKAGCANIVSSVDSIAKRELLPTSIQTGNANYYTFPTQTALDDFTQALFNPSDTLSLFIDGMAAI